MAILRWVPPHQRKPDRDRTSISPGPTLRLTSFLLIVSAKSHFLQQLRGLELFPIVCHPRWRPGMTAIVLRTRKQAIDSEEDAYAKPRSLLRKECCYPVEKRGVLCSSMRGEICGPSGRRRRGLSLGQAARISAAIVCHRPARPKSGLPDFGTYQKDRNRKHPISIGDPVITWFALEHHVKACGYWMPPPKRGMTSMRFTYFALSP
jgi:hypothetical protein